MTMDELITLFREETEDLIRSSVIDMFNIQGGTTAVTVGLAGVSVSLPIPYDSVDEYDIKILSALDADLTDIVDAITVNKISASSFKLFTQRDGTVRWTSSRRFPKIELHNE